MSIENIGTSPAAENYESEAAYGQAGAASPGTAQTTGANTETATSAPGGSTTDVALGAGTSETGLPGSEYASSPPDTEGVYGGTTLPENFVATDLSIGGAAQPAIIDTTIGGGAVHADATPAYRAPSSYVAAGVKDTSLTDILGNQINAPQPVNSAAYAAVNIDTSYSGGPSIPSPLLAQTDTIPSIQNTTPYYASQLGIMPSTLVVTSLGQQTSQTDTITLQHLTPAALSKTGITTAQASIVVTDTTSGHILVLGTDYTLTASGSGSTLTYTVTRINASSLSTDGDSANVTYSYGSANFFTPAVAVLTTDYTVTTAGNGPTTALYLNRASGSTVLVLGDQVTMAYSYGDPQYYDSNLPAAVAQTTTDIFAFSSSSVLLNQQNIQTAASALTVVDLTNGNPLTYNVDYSVATQYLASGSNSTASNLKTYAVKRLLTSPSSAYGDTWSITYSYLTSVPSAPGMGALVGQVDSITLQHSSAASLSKTGIVTTAAALVVTDTANRKVLVMGTDYTVATSGSGSSQTYTITRINSSVNSSDGDGATVAYSYGNAFYFGSGPVIPGFHGVTVPWTPPAGITQVDYYIVQSSTLGTQYVPATGEPMFYGQPSPGGGGDTGEPTYQTDTLTGFNHSSPVSLTLQGVLTPPGQLIVRDITDTTPGDPMQPTGTVLEYGLDYTVTSTGVGPWLSYQIQRVVTSQNSNDGDTITVDYWWTSPTTVSTFFTQGLVENTATIYNPNGTVRSFQGYQFQVAAGNRAGLGPFSGWSDYAVPLNPSAVHGFVPAGTDNTNVFDPANAVNPVYRPDGSIKAGTGIGG